MSGEITLDDFSRMMAGAAAAIRENHSMLSQLDCIAGDGDHGATMLRAVECLQQTFASKPLDSLKASLKQAGWGVLGVDGGASSSLLGVFIGGMANSPACDAPAGTNDLAAIFEAGLAAISRQTKAQPGDKTMMDALVPAVVALRTAGTEGKIVVDAMGDAATAARRGSEATRELTARYGRGKLLGERTRGYIDPGAASMSLLFEGFYRGLQEPKGEGGNYAKD
jgi:dihydroxyacetone kinase-like protein